MDSSTIDLKALSKKIYFSRIRIMDSHSFFGVILHDLKFVFNTFIDTFTTDGMTIYFNPYYLKDLSEYELDICILHILIHISLKHHLRYPTQNKDKLLHRACDIVVNSNLMSSLGTRNREIYVQGKALPHLTPSGKEGYNFTVEEVYQELKKGAQKAHMSLRINAVPKHPQRQHTSRRHPKDRNQPNFMRHDQTTNE